MNNSPWQYFSIKELSCRCGCGGWFMNTEFMVNMVRLRRELGFVFPVTSAFRCSTHNQKVSSTGPNGPHTTGHAIDLGLSHEHVYKVLQAAFNHGFTGIGLQQKGPIIGRFIHLDDLKLPQHRPRPHIWTY